MSEKLDRTIDKWWEFPNTRNLEIFRSSEEKIISPRTASRNSFYLDYDKHIIKGTNSVIVSEKFDLKYVIGILNSDLATYWYREYGYSYHGGKTKKYEPAKIIKYMIPIPKSNEVDQRYIIDRVELIIENTQRKNEIANNFRNWLLFKLRITQLSDKLNDFYKLNENEFRDQLQISRNDLNPVDLEVISSAYLLHKSEINQLISLIIGLDNDVNNKTYDLYGINEDDIQIIKNNLNFTPDQ